MQTSEKSSGWRIWFRYVKKMDEHRIPKGLLEMKMTGKRPRADHDHGG
jgi:hypothetical protein